MSDFLKPFAEVFSDVIAPLHYSFESVEEIELFLARYGWDAQVNSGALGAIQGAFALEALVQTMLQKLDMLINGTREQQAQAALELIEAAKDVVDRIDALAGAASGALPFPFNDATFWGELAGELFEDLLISYLERRQPIIFSVLHVMGVIRFERQTPAGANRIPFTRSRMYWDRLPRLFTGPGDLFAQTYGWNGAFNHNDLLRTLERIFLAFQIQASVAPPRQSLATAFLNPNSITTNNINELEIPIVDGFSYSDNSYWNIGLVVLPVPDPTGSAGVPRGLLFAPLLAGQLSLVQYFTQSIGMRLSGAFETNGNIAAIVYPDSARLQADLAGTAFAASITLFGDPANPWVLIGSPDGARLELGGFLVQYMVEGTIGDPEISISVGTGEHKFNLVISAGDADGFLKTLIGDGFSMEFGGNFHWSSKHGASFDGSAGLEFAKTIHLELGPITIETVYVQARAGTNSGVDLNLGAGIKAVLGPLAIVVENMGLRISLVPTQPGQRGALGSMDVKFGFKPPNGLGLSVDAGVVKGGGYLFFDFDKQEYAGALELTISGYIHLTAIGLLNTRMPDGSQGFSLLIIITAEFGSGLQLGYGFMLMGVGGLLGLNRTMRLQPLTEGVRTGGINGIMFPHDVVANAPRILNDLRSYFPPENGKFLIGPMLKLSWATLITISLGVIIEIPGNIAILGVLKVALPTEEEPILVLQVNFLGAIEFDKKRGYFFAALFESRILFMTIEGEMGLLIAVGDDANFVISVGGFHPRFNPPPLPFPNPRRISINILNESYARIRVMGYFALTTNTVQFGAHAELFFGFSVLTVEGELSFDALIQFSPFYFIIEISASVSLKVFGAGLFSISLRFSLEGPTPWRARGSGSIRLLFFTVSADFDQTWGEARDTSMPPIEVMPIIGAELNKIENWRALPPPSNNLLVSLRPLDATADGLVLHPLGVLRVSQKTIPLDLTIDQVGSQNVADAKRFSISVTTGLSKQGDVNEQYAMAQFKKMSNADKLTQHAYDAQHGGLDLSAAGKQVNSSHMVRRVVRYEEIIIDSNYKRFVKHFFMFLGVLFTHFLAGAAISQSPLSKAHKRKLQPFEETIMVRPEVFVVAFQSNNQRVAVEAAFESEASAHDYLAQAVAQNPKLTDTLHVISETEAVA